MGTLVSVLWTALTEVVTDVAATGCGGDCGGAKGSKQSQVEYKSFVKAAGARQDETVGDVGIGSYGRTGKERKMMNFGYNSIWGLLILAGDIWAIINILQSSASNQKKLIWVIAVVLLPVLGLILWFFLGPRDRKA